MITEITLPALTYTIARNLISDYYRRRNTYEEFEHYIKRSSDDYSSMESMESVISAKELTELLERGLARVPENCREIYRMHIYGGMKVGEISQTLGEGYKSVEHRLGAARKALRSFLENYA
jgi:RNA polymerase sigma-70 factor (ECF subfamily)